MPPQAALLLCSGFVIWLFYSDVRRSSIRSFGSWVVVVWIIVGIARPVTSWFSSGGEFAEGGEADAYDAGNPVIRNLYVVLIAAGLLVLRRRRVDAGRFLRENAPVLFLTLFWGLSVFWSDSPIITLKRWIKDTGTVVMVMVILSETDPVAAFRTVLVRSSYILIPYSMLLIRYFGDLGRIYSRWDGELMYVGVTTHKNTLGVVALVAILSLAWTLYENLRAPRNRGALMACLAPAVVLFASLNLLRMSHSATSQVCTFLGFGIYAGMRLGPLRRQPRRAVVYAAVAGVLLLGLNSVVDVKAAFLEMVGRDPTLTTRTEVWPVLLEQQSSPVLGPGFKAFWSGRRFSVLWETYGILQAHNGYLETYLNGGLVSIALLLILLAAGFLRIFASLDRDGAPAVIRLIFWFIAVIHNFTEASFNTFNPIWMALLVVSAENRQVRFAAPMDPVRSRTESDDNDQSPAR